MNIVLAHNHFNQGKLDSVIAEMVVLGAPKIRVYDLGFDNLVQAIEGCHRLRAAEHLEIEPIIVFVDEDEKIKDLGLDWDDNTAVTVAEIGDWENEQVYF